MRRGIIALTRNALSLAHRLKDFYEDSSIYTLSKWNDPDSSVIEDGLASFTGKIFLRHEILIFITAAGIAVRCIAGCLGGKTKDPGVLVMDEKGKFVISLLSGHIGGANEEAMDVAKFLGAIPVITTASDVNKRLSVDMIALKYGLFINDMKAAKDVTSLIVNEGKIAVVSDIAVDMPDYLSCPADEADAIIFITNRKTDLSGKISVQLFPKNIFLGIGCRKGTDGRKLISFIEDRLDYYGLDYRSISSIASIDIKKDEQGIRETAEYFGCETVFFCAGKLNMFADRFDGSEFVEKIAGVRSVCEPAAFIAGGCEGEFIMKKEKRDGITMAIFEKGSAR
jgi:cobalt-precorrin 5A hydrolase